MDLAGTFEKVITSVATWVVTGVVGPLIVSWIPGAPQWFAQRPWAVAFGVAFLTSGLTATVMWATLRPSPFPSLTPAGAVMAFDLPGGCPSGWTPYEKGNGRFLIGAATPQNQKGTPGDFVRDARGTDLVAREFGKPGGAQGGLLGKENIPPIYLLVRTDNAAGGQANFSLVSSIGLDKPDISKGGGYSILQTSNVPAVPFDVMPPYVALHFCRKT